MSDSTKHLIQDFCEFAGLQDNSDAQLPNIIPSLQLYVSDSIVPQAVCEQMPKWDPLDDPSLLTPEFLTYILLMAKEYWNGVEDA